MDLKPLHFILTILVYIDLESLNAHYVPRVVSGAFKSIIFLNPANPVK